MNFAGGRLRVLRYRLPVPTRTGKSVPIDHSNSWDNYFLIMKLINFKFNSVVPKNSVMYMKYYRPLKNSLSTSI